MRPFRAARQKGHLMVALMLLIAIMSIMSAKVLLIWKDVIQREREAEMMFRGQEIVRAIWKYRRDKGQGVPLTELELLMEPGNRGQYFLRRLYDDPLVRDGKWGLLYGGPGGQIVDPNAAGASEPFMLGEDRPLQPVGGLQQTAVGTREIGGLPIIGVRTLCEDSPFREYKGLKQYNLWLFTIFDLSPQARREGQPAQPGGSQVGQPGRQGGPARPGRPGSRGPRGSGRSGRGG